MKERPDISRLAALIGDPARANMLTALMDGQALTASELAQEAGVTLPTASGHLAKLAESGLIQHRKQGRHKYVQLAGEDVALVLEALMGLAVGRGLNRSRPGPKDPLMRHARVCYNHLAGQKGVQLYRALLRKGVLVETADDTLELTESGAAFMTAFGIDVLHLKQARAPLCRTCLDWSERRSHLAGGLGRALLSRMQVLGWVRQDTRSRVLTFSPPGDRAFAQAFPAE